MAPLLQLLTHGVTLPQPGIKHANLQDDARRSQIGSGLPRRVSASAHAWGQVLTFEGKSCSLSRAFTIISCSEFHDEAHGAFMTLPPYTRSREGETPPLGGVVRTPSGRAFKLGNALRREILCLKTEPNPY